MIPFIESVQNQQAQRTGKPPDVCQGLGRWLMGTGVPLGDRRILKLDTEKFHGMVLALCASGKCTVRLTKGLGRQLSS